MSSSTDQLKLCSNNMIYQGSRQYYPLGKCGGSILPFPQMVVVQFEVGAPGCFFGPSLTIYVRIGSRT